jgi:hypothetical protein
MLSPMVYGLYNQFDAHPEKEMVFMSDAGNKTETNVSGVKFYFWTQSFGRITGDNVWKDGSPPTYFIDTFLWSFLPWSLLGIWALVWRTSNTIVDVVKKRKKQEWLTLGGFILPFIAFSMSSYKLPHYIFVLFPFAAIITSEFVLRVLFEKPAWWGKIMKAIQILVVVAIGVATVLLLTYVFPTTKWLVWLIFIGLYVTALISLFSKERINQVVLSSALAILAANWVLNAHFYPELFKYQPSKALAQFVVENGIPRDRIFIYPSFGFYSFEYYADHTFYNLSHEQIEKILAQNGSVWVYVKKDYLQVLEGRYDHIEIITERDAFHVSMLTPQFLNPATRSDELATQYLVKITPE